MSARAGRDPLAYVVAVAAVLVLALVIVPALGSDRMPPDAVCAAIALLAAGVALVAALAPGWLRRSPARRRGRRSPSPACPCSPTRR